MAPAVLEKAADAGENAKEAGQMPEHLWQMAKTLRQMTKLLWQVFMDCALIPPGRKPADLVFNGNIEKLKTKDFDFIGNHELKVAFFLTFY